MGRIPLHPGNFRKSGKQKTYDIRKMEECARNRKQGVCGVAFCKEERIRGTTARQAGYTPPGMLYECQNKALANWAIRKCMKTKAGSMA
jgi:hypothetical protein